MHYVTLASNIQFVISSSFQTVNSTCRAHNFRDSIYYVKLILDTQFTTSSSLILTPRFWVYNFRYSIHYVELISDTQFTVLSSIQILNSLCQAHWDPNHYVELTISDIQFTMSSSLWCSFHYVELTFSWIIMSSTFQILNSLCRAPFWYPLYYVELTWYSICHFFITFENFSAAECLHSECGSVNLIFFLLSSLFLKNVVFFSISNLIHVLTSHHVTWPCLW